MVLGPADEPEGGPDDQLVDQVGLLPLRQQKWVKTSKVRDADNPKFCWWGSVPRSLWLPSLKRRQELFSPALATREDRSLLSGVVAILLQNVLTPNLLLFAGDIGGGGQTSTCAIRPNKPVLYIFPQSCM